MKSCIQGDDVTGVQHLSQEQGVALAHFTNAMQRGYSALGKDLQAGELHEVCRDIERRASDVGRFEDSSVRSLLERLGEKIPQTSGGWA